MIPESMTADSPLSINFHLFQWEYETPINPPAASSWMMCSDATPRMHRGAFSSERVLVAFAFI
jgi:hypothetical protein